MLKAIWWVMALPPFQWRQQQQTFWCCLDVHCSAVLVCSTLQEPKRARYNLSLQPHLAGQKLSCTFFFSTVLLGAHRACSKNFFSHPVTAKWVLFYVWWSVIRVLLVLICACVSLVYMCYVWQATLDAIDCMGRTEQAVQEVWRVLQPGGFFMLVSCRDPPFRIPTLDPRFKIEVR